ncbi:MAG: metallophosphoesterase family protein, partial [Candidatus Altiarchaeales archaeon]|nr:metallophosphoesterase family protein [Candidatus Altiarchaeales archaeon]
MIGLMSDSHHHMDAIRGAVEFFNSRGVDLVLHAGDLISPFTAGEFGKLGCRFVAVYGNN